MTRSGRRLTIRELPAVVVNEKQRWSQGLVLVGAVPAGSGLRRQGTDVGEGARAPDLVDEGDALVVEVTGGNGADEVEGCGCWGFLVARKSREVVRGSSWREVDRDGWWLAR